MTEHRRGGTAGPLAALCVLAGTLLLILALGAPAVAAARWHPRAGVQQWQWQLQGRVDLSVAAGVYDVDGLKSSRSLVTALHRLGRRAICYVDVGTWEPFRADRDRFPPALLGRPVTGFAGERWLDVRTPAALAGVLGARLRDCAGKGFDGVEPDNVDGYANRTGFPISATDQLRFDRWVAAAAHRVGLAVGLKNDLGQTRALVNDFDFAVVEQCFAFGECSRTQPFIRAAKPVFEAEYELTPARFCARARHLGLSAMRKRVGLNSYRIACAPAVAHGRPGGTG